MSSSESLVASLNSQANARFVSISELKKDVSYKILEFKNIKMKLGPATKEFIDDSKITVFLSKSTRLSDEQIREYEADDMQLIYRGKFNRASRVEFIKKNHCTFS